MKLLQQLAVALFLGISAPILCMDTETDTEASKRHFLLCGIVAQESDKKLAYFEESMKIRDVIEARCGIEFAMQERKKEVNTLQHVALNDIKTAYAIDDIRWNDCLEKAAELKKIFKKNQQLPLDNVVHDTNIPQEFYCVLQEYLQARGINPRRINICLGQDCNGFFIKSPANDEPGLIALPLSSIEDCDVELQKALSQFVAYHVAKYFNIFPEIMIELLKILNIQQDFMSTEVYRNYHKAMMNSFILKLALEKKETAELMDMYYTISYSSNHSVDIYQQLRGILDEWRKCDIVIKEWRERGL